jgi:hypothetical protein
LFPNGDLVAGGYSQTATEKMGLIHRYDAAGNKIWTSIIDSVGAYDEVRDVSVTTSGSVAFTGGSGGNTTYATIVGAITLSRAVDDPKLSDEILKAARASLVARTR